MEVPRGEGDGDEEQQGLDKPFRRGNDGARADRAVASDPWRWKNLTRTAKTATLPPTSELKALDTSSATQRPYGNSPTTAPVSAQAEPNGGNWAKTNASATHPQLAPLMASNALPASDSTPMIAQMPISEPRPNSRLVQLTRLNSASFGTSMPAPLATADRSCGSRPLCCASAALVVGSSAGRCRCTRAPRTVSTSSTRPAAAAVRSTPACTAMAASTLARSASRRLAGATADALRKPLTQTPCSARMIVSPPSAPWASPAARSGSRVRRISSSVPSPRPAPAWDSARPSGTRVTSAASLLGPNLPAARTSGTRIWARAAISVR
jgi:hypothetical protein